VEEWSNMKNYWSDCFSRSVLNAILSAVLIELAESISYFLGMGYTMFMLIPIFFLNFILMRPKCKGTFAFAFLINFISYVCAGIVFSDSVSLLYGLYALYGGEKLSAGSGFAIMCVSALCYICIGFAMLLAYIFGEKEIRDDNSDNPYINLSIKSFGMYCLIGVILLIGVGAISESFLKLPYCVWLFSVLVGIAVAMVSLKKTNAENIFEKIMWFAFNVILFYSICYIERLFYFSFLPYIH
jgi:hypothetical protein